MCVSRPTRIKWMNKKKERDEEKTGVKQCGLNRRFLSKMKFQDSVIEWEIAGTLAKSMYRERKRELKYGMSGQLQLMKRYALVWNTKSKYFSLKPIFL